MFMCVLSVCVNVCFECLCLCVFLSVCVYVCFECLC